MENRRAIDNLFFQPFDNFKVVLGLSKSYLIQKATKLFMRGANHKVQNYEGVNSAMFV